MKYEIELPAPPEGTEISKTLAVPEVGDYFLVGDVWVQCSQQASCKNIIAVKKPKIIDLSSLVGSGIDCEFNCDDYDGFPFIAPIAGISTIAGKAKYTAEDGRASFRCRIRHNHWFYNVVCPNGKHLIECVPEGYRVEWVDSVRKVNKGVPSCISLYEVVTFRITGVAEGYEHG